MSSRPYLIQALSPLHAGTGQSVAAIDLPIARMRATATPFVPGSSVKGVLRHARRPADNADAAVKDRYAAVFGPTRSADGADGDDASIDHAGALMVGDARLLALPVRSFRGTYALATSPFLLHLAGRDLAAEPALGAPPAIPSLPTGDRVARVGKQSWNLHKDHVYLEELDLPAAAEPAVDRWADFIARALPGAEHALIEHRLCVVDDDTMTFLWETATQIDTRVRICSDRGIVAKGALWTEESLPPETLLVGLMTASVSLRKGVDMDSAAILDAAVPKGGEVLQFGGKATVGRGRCVLYTWPREVAPVGKGAKR
ncbi:type III-B CRISPR module RAMP protein Cmr4 [Haliangium sp.]|uniref:type III-B CRISPR module RAMP protein Cmr4 n=1 Tax=Haliangium sp. TaxID=2663208 RepID=UPI003D11A7EA